jgi:hypothetical protein
VRDRTLDRAADTLDQRGQDREVVVVERLAGVSCCSR